MLSHGGQLFLGDWQHIQEGLHGRLAVAPTSLVRPLSAVLFEPRIRVRLQRFDARAEFLSKRAVELVEHGLVETRASAVGPRASCPCPRVLNVLDGKVARTGAPLFRRILSPGRSTRGAGQSHALRRAEPRGR